MVHLILNLKSIKYLRIDFSHDLLLYFVSFKYNIQYGQIYSPRKEKKWKMWWVVKYLRRRNLTTMRCDFKKHRSNVSARCQLPFYASSCETLTNLTIQVVVRILYKCAKIHFKNSAQDNLEMKNVQGELSHCGSTKLLIVLD